MTTGHRGFYLYETDDLSFMHWWPGPWLILSLTHIHPESDSYIADTLHSHSVCHWDLFTFISLLSKSQRHTRYRS